MSKETKETRNSQGSGVSRWILFGGVLVLVVSVCLLFAGPFLARIDRGYETESQNDPNADPTFSESVTESVAGSDLTANSSLADQSKPTSNLDSGQISSSRSKLSDPSVMWEHVEVDEVEEAEIPKLPREIADRVLVRMNASVWTTTKGHLVQFPIPQRDIVLIGEVTAVAGTPLAPTLKGEVEDLGVKFPFVMTLGDANAYATVSSSTGNYELYANRDYGWVMSAHELSAHIDYSVPHSFIENPDPHSGHEHIPH